MILNRHKSVITNPRRSYANSATPSIDDRYIPPHPTDRHKSDPTALSRPSPYTPDAILTALISAGLGDITQSILTQDQIDRALRGEKVRLDPGQRRRHLNETATIDRNVDVIGLGPSLGSANPILGKYRGRKPKSDAPGTGNF